MLRNNAQKINQVVKQIVGVQRYEIVPEKNIKKSFTFDNACSKINLVGKQGIGVIQVCYTGVKPGAEAAHQKSSTYV